MPKFLRGPFRNALKFALEEAIAPDEVRQSRGWKFFMMLPRMLLHRPPGGGLISKSKLEAGFIMFNRGNWTELIRASAKCDDLAAVSRRRHARRQGFDDDLKRRVARAEMLVHYGELSSSRQALEGASLAPGNQETLNMLRDESRRPPRLRDPLPEEVLNLVPEDSFQLDDDRFCRNLRSGRRGGPSGMTTEHLRPLLDDVRGMRLLSCLASNLAGADVPEVAVQMVRVGRLTALAKPDGGVRGIVAGDVVRRLPRTIAQQLSAAVETATAPHQYALSTKAGTECIAHVLQSLTELHPEATVTSIDVISAYDKISREAMLQGLARLEGGRSALPFVRLFYGAPSEYLWEDESGTTHRIPQGEGGEQGDAMMPLLFCLGQHEALRATQEQLRDGEHLLAFLDDIYMVTRPDRVGPVYANLQENLHVHACIRIHCGKTKVWNKAGIRPAACDALERIARIGNPPLGHEDFVAAHLESVLAEHHTFISRIPEVKDVQSAWLLLLHCASARACYLTEWSVHLQLVFSQRPMTEHCGSVCRTF